MLRLTESSQLQELSTVRYLHLKRYRSIKLADTSLDQSPLISPIKGLSHLAKTINNGIFFCTISLVKENIPLSLIVQFEFT